MKTLLERYRRKLVSSSQKCIVVTDPSRGHRTQFSATLNRFNVRSSLRSGAVNGFQADRRSSGSNPHEQEVAYTRMCPPGLAGQYLCGKGLRLRIQAYMSDKPGSACGVRQMKSRLLHLRPGSGHDDRLEADRSHGRREDRENTLSYSRGRRRNWSRCERFSQRIRWVCP